MLTLLLHARDAIVMRPHYAVAYARGYTTAFGHERAAMAEDLRISVIVCAHNEARHLPACLHSVLAQSRQPDELLVINNASTDETAAVGRRFRWSGDLLARVGRMATLGLHRFGLSEQDFEEYLAEIGREGARSLQRYGMLVIAGAEVTQNRLRGRNTHRSSRWRRWSRQVPGALGQRRVHARRVGSRRAAYDAVADSGMLPLSAASSPTSQTFRRARVPARSARRVGA